MAYEERRVVTDDPVETVPASTVRTQPETVVEQRPRTVISEDPVGNAYAASQLIQTIVWSVVVLVLLVVALWALHVYAHLF
jgi:hypothetical protein